MSKVTNYNTPNVIGEILKARKRAKYFAQDIVWDGLFSPIVDERLSAMLQTGVIRFLSETSDIDEELIQSQLWLIWRTSVIINEWLDNNQVKDNEWVKVVLASYLSAIEPWCGWDKLQIKKEETLAEELRRIRESSPKVTSEEAYAQQARAMAGITGRKENNE